MNVSILFALVLLAGSDAAALVRHVRAPADGTSVSVVLDGEGVVHAVCGQGAQVFYYRSEDLGETWSDGARLDSGHECISTGERGPRIALGRAGRVHVVWMGERGEGVWYTRGRPGEGFDEPRDLRGSDAGVDGPTICANAEGRVWVFWLDGREGGDPRNPVGSPIYFAESRDDGETFSAARRLETAYDGRGCACCMLDANVAADGRVWLAFRGAREGVRDTILAVGTPGEDPMQAGAVANDNWVLRACPMDGPSVAISGGGGRATCVVIAWKVREEVRWARVDARGTVHGPWLLAEGPRVKYPLALVSSDGRACLAWLNGQTLWYAVFDERGRRVVQERIEAVRAERPATGFVAPDGTFRIVY